MCMNTNSAVMTGTPTTIHDTAGAFSDGERPRPSEQERCRCETVSESTTSPVVMSEAFVGALRARTRVILADRREARAHTYKTLLARDGRRSPRRLFSDHGQKIGRDEEDVDDGDLKPIAADATTARASRVEAGPRHDAEDQERLVIGLDRRYQPA